MINISVIDSDAFLSLPQTAQNLYFHLNMRADDDGFVDSPKKIMRIVGATDGDMQQLLQKRYLLIFESGVIVIKHWRLHNTLRSDRKIPTNYQEELSQLVVQKNKTYTEKDNPKLVGQPNDNQPSTNGCHRLVESSIGEIRLEENSEDKTEPKALSLGSMKNVKLTQDEYDRLVKDYDESKVNDTIESLSLYMSSKGKRYKSHNATIRAWIRKDLEKEKPSARKFNTEQGF